MCFDGTKGMKPEVVLWPSTIHVPVNIFMKTGS